MLAASLCQTTTQEHEGVSTIVREKEQRYTTDVEGFELQHVMQRMSEKERNYVCQVTDGANSMKVESDPQLSRSPITVTMNSFAHTDLIGEQERHEVVKWMYRVVDHYGFDRETVTIAMSYFDRMLWKAASNNILPPCHELLAITSVYLAVKLIETTASKRSYLLRDLVLMSRRKFDKEQIIEMESEILMNLSWNVHPTTPQLFSFYFLKVLSKNMHSTRTSLRGISKETLDSCIRKVLEMANFLIELSLFDSSLVEEMPSTIAGAAIQIALKGFHRSDPIVIPVAVNTVPTCDSTKKPLQKSMKTGVMINKMLLNTFTSMCNGSRMADTHDIIPMAEIDLYSVEHKLGNFLQNYTTSMEDIQASLMDSSF